MPLPYGEGPSTPPTSSPYGADPSLGNRHPSPAPAAPSVPYGTPTTPTTPTTTPTATPDQLLGLEAINPAYVLGQSQPQPEQPKEPEQQQGGWLGNVMEHLRTAAKPEPKTAPRTSRPAGPFAPSFNPINAADIGRLTLPHLLEQIQQYKQQVRRDARLKDLEQPVVTTGIVGTINGMQIAAPMVNTANIESNRAIGRRLDREAILDERIDPGREKPEPEGAKHGDVSPMTWDEYNALTDRQRAAVDYNTLLVQAVRKDKKMNREGTYAPDEQTERTYDRRVDKIFGPDDGAKLYAPETLALLEQLDIKDNDASLNDFLHLRTAITADDIEMIDRHGISGPGLDNYPALNDTEEQRLAYVRESASATRDLERDLAQEGHVLQSLRASAAADRNAILPSYGGTVNKIKPGLGYGVGQFDPNTGDPMDANAYFQAKYADLATAGYNEAQIREKLQAAADVLGPLGQLQDFYNYIDQRSRAASDTGAELMPGTKGNWRSPEEFRKLLGLD